MKPWAFEVAYVEPFQALRMLSPSDKVIFFDSANFRPELGRYSYIALDPFLTLKFQQEKTYLDGCYREAEPFALLEECFQNYQLDTIADLPPFQGGVAGVFCYDLLTQFEQVTLPNNSTAPEMFLGFYDLVLAFDQTEKKAWIFSSGFPELDPVKRQQRAEQRYQEMLIKLQQIPEPLPAYELSEIVSNFTEQEYCCAVEKIKQYIFDGDVFEVCLSQRFSCHYQDEVNPLSIYQRLRAINPAPFAAYLKFDELTLLSASPERFLQLRNNIVESRPIKGTCKRSNDPQIDQELAQALLTSEKDRAENAMIVDLLRNDLSKVCKDGTVNVANFAQLESYATVHHLVSSVTGELRPESNAIDLLQAAFPGGSITGAPKVRAMQIISEIEPDNRSAYCGNLVYLGFDGCMDSSILIRTMVMYQNELSFHAGGAVVLDSDPLSEYQETLNKAKALHTTLAVRVSA